MRKRYIGLMTGTSLDSVDSALIEHTQDGYHYIDHIEWPMPAALRQAMFALYEVGHNELERAAMAAYHHAQTSADSVQALLQANHLKASDITAIGSHGQTLRHQPHHQPPYTIQCQHPALLCELTHIDVIADFRQRDVAAGGQGAPLAPLFHRGLLNLNQACVVNIGGIANISVINDAHISGYDCGPGNGLLDAWIEQQRQLPYDNQGDWARSGQIITELLDQLLQCPYFQLPPPKSSGRDHFNLAWLADYLRPSYRAQDVQRTLLELTARSIAEAVNRSVLPLNWPTKTITFVGGGAKNTFLIERIQALLAAEITTTPCLIPEQAMEAAGFAWLAAQYCQDIALPLTNITGAKGARLLGAWYKA